MTDQMEDKESRAKRSFSEILSELGPITSEHFQQIWQDAHFCLDTNVLLNAYRYSETQGQKFLDILDSIRNRIFIPHTVAREFARNRKAVIRDRFAPVKLVRQRSEKIIEEINTAHGKHPDKERVLSIVNEMLKELDSEFKEVELENQNLVSNDQIAKRISEMLKDRVGKPLSEEAAETEFNRRREDSVPPYCSKDDANKNSDDAMGDVILWLELMEEYQGQAVPLIFVTDDQKSNWWEKNKGHNEPNRRLLIEMAECTGSVCLFYTAERFIDTAGQQLKIQNTEELERETKEIAKRQNERMRRKHEEVIRERKEAKKRNYLAKKVMMAKKIDEIRSQLELEKNERTFIRSQILSVEDKGKTALLRRLEEALVFQNQKIADLEAELEDLKHGHKY